MARIGIIGSAGRMGQALVEAIAPLFGLQRLARWVRFGSIAFVVLGEGGGGGGGVGPVGLAGLPPQVARVSARADPAPTSRAFLRHTLMEPILASLTPSSSSR